MGSVTCRPASTSDQLDSAKGGQVYAGINGHDAALAVSALYNGDERLGNDQKAPFEKPIVYIDYTGAPGVGTAHNLALLGDAAPEVKAVYQRVFHGGDGTEGLYKVREQYYALVEPESDAAEAEAARSCVII